MWPGSDLPMGPPPQPPTRPGAPSGKDLPPVRPGSGWYALPLALVLVPLLIFIVVFALNWQDSQAADGPSASGDARAGISVELKAGHTYFLYVRLGDPTPASCALVRDGRPDPFPLTREHSWSASDRTGYRYAATFEAPLTGSARLTCEGSGDMLMTPDDTSYGYLGLAMLACLGLGAAGGAAFVVIAVMRNSSVKRRRAAAMGPYGTPY
ncbi:hypothetical protein [Actinomadura rugatobispora]|uniref:DUF4333 domain-containing protein n=1 Tax=Actinomadura rugatobispora TaxID=1994 RepID=A0ABW1AA29_9ACTN|nr:hypothetical protein GCM10010200_075260 [Actinomadura rugatobispora]